MLTFRIIILYNCIRETITVKRPPTSIELHNKEVVPMGKENCGVPCTASNYTSTN